MKLIQSYWFGPFSALTSSRFRGGFPSPRHFWSSVALSCVLAREAFGAVEFHTDHGGARAVSELGIPYDQVKLTLSELPPVPTFMWAYGKLVVCSQQSAPYLHLDTDAFLFEPLPSDLLAAELLVQSLEWGTGHEQFYRPAAAELAANLPVPKSIQQYVRGERPFRALNCGMLGGRATEFLSAVLTRAARLIDDPSHAATWRDIGVRHREGREQFNCVIEQLALTLAAEDAGITPTMLFQLGANDQIPKDHPGYLHLIGNNKFEAALLKRVDAELHRRAPHLAQRIQERFP